MADRIIMLFDVKLKRPGCALLQAVFGGDYGSTLYHFDSNTWLTSPTDDMRLLSGTAEEWKTLAEKVNAAQGETKRSNRKRVL